VNGFLRVSRNASLALALALGLICATVRPAPCATPAPAPGAVRLITLDAEDAPLPSVLKILAEKGDLNIITGVGATSTGRLTIHMKDVPLDQAVNLVVRAAGLAYERIGNSILVADPQALKEETGLSSYVVELRYADAVDVKEALKSIASDIQVDKGGNRLVVVTSPRVISQIEEIVRVLDVPARQVLLEARILEVSTADVMKLGIDWDRLNSQGFVIVEGGSGSAKQGAAPDSLPFYGSSGGAKGLWSARPMARQALAWQTAIDLMIHEGKARLLASPKIATLNGREASILIGSRIPFVVTGTVFAGGGAAPVQRIEKEEVGIKLRITPLINADGYITTQITPEVSSVVDYKGSNSDLPVVATRQASTTVRLKDGNSVIIGGLLSEEKTTSITKVPFLGDIPMLGLLFQHRGTSTTKRDLVIEVTPHILPDQQ
jgi:type IV pilus secretin PilQ/predicted competence protein